jgi:hypothetical protein
MFADIPPKPGDIVSVRTREYLVNDVVPGAAGDMTLVRLACLNDDAQGVPLEVLWEAEVDARPATGDAWSRVARRGFDEPRTFAAYLHALRWSTVTATNPRLFQASPSRRNAPRRRQRRSAAASGPSKPRPCCFSFLNYPSMLF